KSFFGALFTPIEPGSLPPCPGSSMILIPSSDPLEATVPSPDGDFSSLEEFVLVSCSCSDADCAFVNQAAIHAVETSERASWCQSPDVSFRLYVSPAFAVPIIEWFVPAPDLICTSLSITWTVFVCCCCT